MSSFTNALGDVLLFEDKMGSLQERDFKVRLAFFADDDSFIEKSLLCFKIQQNNQL